ncbi:MAG: hypothetical protein IPL88_12560 [Rhizobiales bacterium]|nr:hypothetical protein [Hyphomicrobiales bacterium]
MMALFAPLAAYAANEVRGVVGRQVSRIAGYAIAALGAVGLAIVGLVSLHRYLGDLWGPYMADLALAGVMIAVIAAGYVYALLASRPPREAPQASALSAAAASAPAALGLLKAGGRGGLYAAAAAILVGVLAGRAAQR